MNKKTNAIIFVLVLLLAGCATPKKIDPIQISSESVIDYSNKMIIDLSKEKDKILATRYGETKDRGTYLMFTNHSFINQKDVEQNFNKFCKKNQGYYKDRACVNPFAPNNVLFYTDIKSFVEPTGTPEVFINVFVPKKNTLDSEYIKAITEHGYVPIKRRTEMEEAFEKTELLKKEHEARKHEGRYTPYSIEVAGLKEIISNVALSHNTSRSKSRLKNKKYSEGVAGSAAVNKNEEIVQSSTSDTDTSESTTANTQEVSRTSQIDISLDLQTPFVLFYMKKKYPNLDNYRSLNEEGQRALFSTQDELARMARDPHQIPRLKAEIERFLIEAGYAGTAGSGL